MRQWKAGGPGVLWSMGSRRVGHDLTTKQQKEKNGAEFECYTQVCHNQKPRSGLGSLHPALQEGGCGAHKTMGKLDMGSMNNSNGYQADFQILSVM